MALVLAASTPSFGQLTPVAKETLLLADGTAIDRLTVEKAGSLAGRNIDIWMPQGIAPDQKLWVIYAHDGQNLFDGATAYGGESWQLHQSAQQLIDAGIIPPCMIVGIWNSPARFEEYLPAPAYHQLPPARQKKLQAERSGSPKSDAYLTWLVEELKPFVDQHYPTLPEPQHTVILGSSMGGLISAYAMAQYPHIFGKAACLSTHWPLSLKENSLDNSLPFRTYLIQNLPQTGQHRLWMDYGTATLDAWYEPHQLAFDIEIKKRTGWQSAKQYQSKKYPDAPHNEIAWRERVGEVLAFLIQP